MKKIIVLVLILNLAGIVFARKIATIPDMVNPDRFLIYGNNIYITEDAKISIYSLKNGSFIRRFGEEGEGPKEFYINRASGWDMIGLFINNNQLVVNSSGKKLTYLSLDGEYLREERLPAGVGGGVLEPFGENFVSTKYKTGDDDYAYHTIVMYDSKFNKIKEIYSHKHGFQNRRGEAFNPLAVDQAFFTIADNKIFVIEGDKSAIHVFNKDGEQLFTVTNPDEKIAFTDKDKEEIIESYKFNQFWKSYYEKKKILFKFPNYFPSIRWFFIEPKNKKIYVQTYDIKNEEKKYIVYDFEGKLLKRCWLPFNEGFNLFYDEKLYQLIETDKEEVWEIQVFDIN